jgi:inosine kinase
MSDERGAVRFPGRRKHKHYFPVRDRDPLLHHAGVESAEAKVHVVGLDQTLVDIDARVDDELLARYALPKGDSTLIPTERAASLYDELLGTPSVGASRSSRRTANERLRSARAR